MRSVAADPVASGRRLLDTRERRTRGHHSSSRFSRWGSVIVGESGHRHTRPQTHLIQVNNPQSPSGRASHPALTPGLTPSKKQVFPTLFATKLPTPPPQSESTARNPAGESEGGKSPANVGGSERPQIADRGRSRNDQTTSRRHARHLRALQHAPVRSGSRIPDGFRAIPAWASAGSG